MWPVDIGCCAHYYRQASTGIRGDVEEDTVKVLVMGVRVSRVRSRILDMQMIVKVVFRW